MTKTKETIAKKTKTPRKRFGQAKPKPTNQNQKKTNQKKQNKKKQNQKKQNHKIQKFGTLGGEPKAILLTVGPCFFAFSCFFFGFSFFGFG